MTVQSREQDPVTLEPINVAIGTGVIVDAIAVAAMSGPGEVLPAAGIGAGVGAVAVLGAGLSRTDRFTQGTARIVAPFASAAVEGGVAIAQYAPTNWAEWVAAGTRAGLSALSSLMTTRSLTKDTRPNR